jgi:hypothetical protein
MRWRTDAGTAAIALLRRVGMRAPTCAVRQTWAGDSGVTTTQTLWHLRTKRRVNINARDCAPSGAPLRSAAGAGMELACAPDQLR